MLTIIATVLLSSLAYILVYKSIPKVSPLFITAGLFGRDLNKNKTPQVPESQGLVCGTVFLISMFIYLGVEFGQHFTKKNDFPHMLFSEFLTALLCICCMLLLGFADDVLNLQWRYKLLLPTIASCPLLMVYYINGGSTTIILPKIVRFWAPMIDIGPLYYIYMSLLAVFCTNAINIYAGINGLESGQALIISLSVSIFNIIEMGGFQRDAHIFSFSLMLPFASTSAALYCYNRYPAKAFVGDTFTYFAGMTFAVVGIIGHFSKSMLLFFIPQVINFIYSTPQLFRIIPCPRHRIPRYNVDLDIMEISTVKMKKSDLLFFNIFKILSNLKIIQLEEIPETEYITINNLTVINLILIWFGPLKEDVLSRRLLLAQVLFSAVAFMIRYPMANFFYD